MLFSGFTNSQLSLTLIHSVPPENLPCCVIGDGGAYPGACGQGGHWGQMGISVSFHMSLLMVASSLELLCQGLLLEGPFHNVPLPGAASDRLWERLCLPKEQGLPDQTLLGV